MASFTSKEEAENKIFLNILKLDQNSEAEAITPKWRKFILGIHPDQCKFDIDYLNSILKQLEINLIINTDVDKRKACEEIFKNLNNIYERLTKKEDTHTESSQNQNIFIEDLKFLKTYAEIEFNRMLDLLEACFTLLWFLKMLEVLVVNFDPKEIINKGDIVKTEGRGDIVKTEGRGDIVKTEGRGDFDKKKISVVSIIIRITFVILCLIGIMNGINYYLDRELEPNPSTAPVKHNNTGLFANIAKSVGFVPRAARGAVKLAEKIGKVPTKILTNIVKDTAENVSKEQERRFAKKLLDAREKYRTLRELYVLFADKPDDFLVDYKGKQLNKQKIKDLIIQLKVDEGKQMNNLLRAVIRGEILKGPTTSVHSTRVPSIVSNTLSYIDGGTAALSAFINFDEAFRAAHRAVCEDSESLGFTCDDKWTKESFEKTAMSVDRYLLLAAETTEGIAASTSSAAKIFGLEKSFLDGDKEYLKDYAGVTSGKIVSPFAKRFYTTAGFTIFSNTISYSSMPISRFFPKVISQFSAPIMSNVGAAGMIAVTINDSMKVFGHLYSLVVKACKGAAPVLRKASKIADFIEDYVPGIKIPVSYLSAYATHPPLEATFVIGPYRGVEAFGNVAYSTLSEVIGFANALYNNDFGDYTNNRKYKLLKRLIEDEGVTDNVSLNVSIKKIFPTVKLSDKQEEELFEMVYSLEDDTKVSSSSLASAVVKTTTSFFGPLFIIETAFNLWGLLLDPLEMSEHFDDKIHEFYDTFIRHLYNLAAKRPTLDPTTSKALQIGNIYGGRKTKRNKKTKSKSKRRKSSKRK